MDRKLDYFLMLEIIRNYKSLETTLDNYKKEDILYNTYMLEKAGYIEALQLSDNKEAVITSLTKKGLKFVACFGGSKTLGYIMYKKLSNELDFSKLIDPIQGISYLEERIKKECNTTETLAVGFLISGVLSIFIWPLVIVTVPLYIAYLISHYRTSHKIYK